MQTNQPMRSSRPVAIWLLVGIGMIIVQVLLGGITRLTGSGLSITEWKPIMGTLPPMNQQDWITAFEKYKQIAQFKYLNAHFTLHDFKHIFFWEWIHRLWARLIGVAFIIPFIIFIIQRRFTKQMIRPMIILFLLGLLQGLVGWIMVRSGLEDSELLYVSHYKLAIHFILALGLVVYVLWFAMELLIPKGSIVFYSWLNKMTYWIVAVLVLQLIYGAFMAGLKAAAAAPTWPTINGHWFPSPVYHYGDKEFSGLSVFTDQPLIVHFIHRTLAYALVILVLIWWWKARKFKGTELFQKTKNIPLILVFIQAILGISTVLSPLHPSRFVFLGVMHQFVAMLLLLSLVWFLFIIRKAGPFASAAFDRPPES